MNRAILLLVVVLAMGCTPRLQTSAPTPVVVEQLFFGRNLNGQQVVSDSAWAAFVGDVVTPRFPSGFTVWQAVGQWRGADGRIEHEPSFVLEVVHPPSRTADADVVAVIEAYKARFHQESVLRVTAPARVAF